MKARYIIEYWDKYQNTILARMINEPKTVTVFGRNWMRKVKRLESNGCQILAVYDISGYTRVPVYPVC